jgi:hypothetical protein
MTKREKNLRLRLRVTYKKGGKRMRFFAIAQNDGMSSRQLFSIGNLKI